MKTKPFNAGPPLAYFITWTMYGTWLPGDERGWRQRDEPETKSPDRLYREMAFSSMAESPFRATASDRDIIQSTIERHCEIRAWKLHQLSVRSNHLHLVLSAPNYQPNTIRDQLKAWCTRKLKRFHLDRKRFWTEGASCRWINHQEDLEAAILYASEEVQNKNPSNKPR